MRDCDSTGGPASSHHLAGQFTGDAPSGPVFQDTAGGYVLATDEEVRRSLRKSISRNAEIWRKLAAT